MTTTGIRSNQERRNENDRRKVKGKIDPDRRENAERRSEEDRREEK